MSNLEVNCHPEQTKPALENSSVELDCKNCLPGTQKSWLGMAGAVVDAATTTTLVETATTLSLAHISNTQQ